MYRYLLLVIHLSILASQGNAVSSEPNGTDDGEILRDRAGSESSVPARDTPRALWDAWVRFHEVELCQGVDAVFRFSGDGIEIWGAIEDEKSYHKFAELLDPLRASFQVVTYWTRPPVEKRPTEDRNPPPSLWNNAELREYLQDPLLRNLRNTRTVTIRPPYSRASDPDFLLKQRMTLFAEQTLDWDKKMKRHAAELPALIHVASDPAASSDARGRATAICLAHAQSVDRYAEKLAENLEQALPKGSKRFHFSDEKPTGGVGSAVDEANEVARAADTLALQIYHFIHPQRHTVQLMDLREPSLLEALRSLRIMVSEFQIALGKH